MGCYLTAAASGAATRGRNLICFSSLIGSYINVEHALDGGAMGGMVGSRGMANDILADGRFGGMKAHSLTSRGAASEDEVVCFLGLSYG